jgi:hypothetical protein
LISFDKVIRSVRYRIKFLSSKFDVLVAQSVNDLLVSNKRDMFYRDKIYIWVPVWGEKHINMFFDYTLPSLCQKGNLPSLSDYEIILNIYTLDNDVNKIKKGLSDAYTDVNFKITTKSEIGFHDNDMMLLFYQDILKKSYENRALLVVAQPDLIFSDGSIFNAIELANGKGVSIAAAHPRISTEGVSATDLKKKLELRQSISSKMLVKLSMDNKHSTLEYASDLKSENTTSSGISTRCLSKHSMAVIHNLPAVYVVAPTKSDIKFFNRQVSFNTIDKVWPALLLREMRLKYIGSSDLFFCAELTDDADRPGKPEKCSRYNDSYSGIKPFMNCANTIIFSWDGEA